MERVTRTLLLPLQLTVLLILHAVFALYRLGRVLRDLPSTVRARLATTRPDDGDDGDERLGADVSHARWDKTPRHLAVVFVPSKLSWSRRRSERAELTKLEQDLDRLVRWAETLGLESVSLYDEQGILDRNAEAVSANLAASFPLLRARRPSPDDLTGSTTFLIAHLRVALLKDELLEGPGREVDSGCGASERDESAGTLSASTSTLVSPPSSGGSPTSSFLTVSLLSRRSGRPHLARIAQQLAERIETNGCKSLPEGAVEEAVEASSLAEPDLLIVLGGPYLRLHGFPPWQVRLTEMHHHPSPSWLPPPPLTYPVFRKALDLYGHAEKRLGR